MMVTLVCSKCCKSYTTRGSLNRHIKLTHKKTEQFICNECGNRYDYKCTLLRHILSKHREIPDDDKFECSDCGKKYLHKHVLVHHILIKHMPEQNENTEFHNGGTYSDGSQSQFTPTSIQRVECHDCGRRYSYKHSLRRHITAVHFEKECDKCGEKFRSKGLLKRHMISRHSIEQKPIERRTFTCLLCGKLLSSEFDIVDHYKIAHALEMTVENRTFESEREFAGWKLDVERQHRCTYIKRDKYKNANTHKTTVVFRCNRSGFHTPIPTQCRKRRLKVQGSKKLNGFCPSKILVHVSADGVYNVVFITTHVGHGNDYKELAHMNHSQEVKEIIVKKLASGLPPAKIVADIVRSSSGGQKSKHTLDKIDLLTEKDIYNIASSHNMKFKNRFRDCVSDDSAAVDDWVAANTESVYFYKRQGDIDRSDYGLRRDDFALVFMKSEQVDTFARLSSGCILVDGTYGYAFKQANYSLHTVVVVDKCGKAYPVCFLVTNRRDASAVDVMFACIRRKFGVIRAHVFMSDPLTGYWDSWIRTMEARPRHHLHCSWHLMRAWRKNFGKVKSSDKKTALSLRLTALLHEDDVATFDRLLAELLTDDDDDLQSFVAHFRDTCAASYKKWAVCYRRHAGVSTNIRLDRSKLFKYSQGRCLTLAQVRNTLIHLDQFLFRKIRSEIRENVMSGKFGCDDDASTRAVDESNLDEKLYDVTEIDDEEIEFGCDIDISMRNFDESHADVKSYDTTEIDVEERKLGCDIDISMQHFDNLDVKSYDIADIPVEENEFGCDSDTPMRNVDDSDEKSYKVTEVNIEVKEKPKLYVLERIKDDSCPDCPMLCAKCSFCPHQFRCLCRRSNHLSLNAGGEEVEQVDEVEVFEPFVMETVLSESVETKPSETSKAQSTRTDEFENRKQRLKTQFEEFINETSNDREKFDMLQKYFERMKRTFNSMNSPNIVSAALDS